MSAVNMRHLNPSYGNCPGRYRGVEARKIESKDKNPVEMATTVQSQPRKQHGPYFGNKPNAEDGMNCANTRCKPLYLNASEQTNPEGSRLASPAR
ncbi:hypothetical protein AVEN_111932-1 [Araneus ventricosus]|uniref:Uncharacterized protein n=1 Tax=Araneus ventricosus TaxID=182803 RepID=A0A4Y2L3Y0_ARAVE|nr:hypothetical protein AVEN_111932-1 [Araneus ventricosus]